jgi:hypothetical protein
MIPQACHGARSGVASVPLATVKIGTQLLHVLLHQKPQAERSRVTGKDRHNYVIPIQQRRESGMWAIESTQLVRRRDELYFYGTTSCGF